jgi:hypothetical protein
MPKILKINALIPISSASISLKERRHCERSEAICQVMQVIKQDHQPIKMTAKPWRLLRRASSQ